MGIPLLQGRDFTEQDRTNTPQLVIVDETFVKNFKLGSNVLGRRLVGLGDGTESADIIGSPAHKRGVFALELIKSLKQSQPAVSALVLSMHDESLYAERALRAGAKGYIMKRETTKKVIDTIRRVLEGKIYISNTVADAITARSVTGRSPASQTPIEQLSDRELEVFEMLGQGLGTRQIAEALRVSIKTVQVYCAQMKEKMNLGSVTELLREAIHWNESKHPR